MNYVSEFITLYFQVVSSSNPSQSSPPPHYLRICVKIVSGKVILLDLSEFVTIETVKMMTEDEEGIPRAEQTLQFAGKQLGNGFTLSDYNIPNNSTLILVNPNLYQNVNRQPSRL